MYEEYGLEYIDTSNKYYYFRGENVTNTKDLVSNEKGRYLDRISKQKYIVLLAGVTNLILALGNFALYVRYNDKILIVGSLPGLIIGVVLIKGYCTLCKKIDNMKEEGVIPTYTTKFVDWPNFKKFIVIFIILLIIYFTIYIGFNVWLTMN